MAKRAVKTADPVPAPEDVATDSQSLLLPEMLDLAAASVLAKSLLAARGSDMTINAGAVRHLGAQCAQVLASAVLTWRHDRADMQIVEGSASHGRPSIARSDLRSRYQGSSVMSKVVLTVDDSRTMRDMLKAALSSAGYSVVQAEDGVHGSKCSGIRPDVIITDINMPRMDGFGFIAGVRKDEGPNRAVPILVLSTESAAEKKNKARTAGATGWIVKPFDPVKLVDAVRRVAA